MKNNTLDFYNNNFFDPSTAVTLYPFFMNSRLSLPEPHPKSSIWACVSLLHVNKNHIVDVIKNVSLNFYPLNIH